MNNWVPINSLSQHLATCDTSQPNYIAINQSDSCHRNSADCKLLCMQHYQTPPPPLGWESGSETRLYHAVTVTGSFWMLTVWCIMDPEQQPFVLHANRYIYLHTAVQLLSYWPLIVTAFVGEMVCPDMSTYFHSPWPKICSIFASKFLHILK